MRQDGNRALTDYSVIVGGKANIVREESSTTGSGQFGSILGGHNLVAQSHGQTVMGYWNKTQGNRTVATNAHNDRLLIIGNGTGEDALRSNAFEVSANGHSIVYHNNGTGGATGSGGLPTPDVTKGAIKGATYNDNIIYGWGTVATNLANLPNRVDVINDFGISRVQRFNPGRYIVTLNPVDPYTGQTINLTSGSIVATINNNDQAETPICRFISTSTLGVPGTNQFYVTISTVGTECQFIDHTFTFHVTARP